MINFINSSSISQTLKSYTQDQFHIYNIVHLCRGLIDRIHIIAQEILGKQLGTVATVVIVALTLCTILYGLYKMIAIIQNRCCNKDISIKGEFPESLDNVNIINDSIGGTSGAKLVGNCDKSWVLKTGAKSGPSSRFCLNEYYANKLYKILEVPVPEVSIYCNKSKKVISSEEQIDTQEIVMLSKFIKGEILEEYLKKWKKDPDKIMALYKKLQTNFVADCLFANWDVLGGHFDNILVDPEGTPWRIDNGGSLEYRARGELKNSAWSSEVKELDTLRNSKLNETAAQIFSSISNQSIIDQINNIVKKQEELLKIIPTHLQSVINERIQYLINYKDRLESEKIKQELEVQEKLNDNKQTVVFDKNYPMEKLVLNNISFTSIPPKNWKEIPDVVLNEPPFEKVDNLRVSAGVIIEEDNRYWLYEPTNHFGGYQHTFPKGRLEAGLTMQQTALKEAWEESGLHVEIIDWFDDRVGDTSKTRYYRAKRISGNPFDAHWESQKVKLVPKEQLHNYLTNKNDTKLLKKLQEI